MWGPQPTVDASMHRWCFAGKGSRGTMSWIATIADVRTGITGAESGPNYHRSEDKASESAELAVAVVDLSGWELVPTSTDRATVANDTSIFFHLSGGTTAFRDELQFPGG